MFGIYLASRPPHYLEASDALSKHIRMCFKFHQYCTRNEEFNFWRVKGGEVPQLKKMEKPHTKWWSHYTPKVAILRKLESV